MYIGRYGACASAARQPKTHVPVNSPPPPPPLAFVSSRASLRLIKYSSCAEDRILSILYCFSYSVRRDVPCRTREKRCPFPPSSPPRIILARVHVYRVPPGSPERTGLRSVDTLAGRGTTITARRAGCSSVRHCGRASRMAARMEEDNTHRPRD